MIRVVCGIIVREGRLFAARRGPGLRHAGNWEFPGGKVEAGESDEVALARELREELALDVRVGPLVAHVRHPDLELIAYRCTTDGTPQPSEHDRVGWFTPSDLDDLPMSPPNREVSAHVSRPDPTPGPGGRTPRLP